MSTPTTQAIHQVTNTAALVYASNANRVGLYIQNYRWMNIWIGLGQDPTEEGGILLRKMGGIELAQGTPGSGNSTNYYTGAVHIMQFSNTASIPIYIVELE